MRVFYVKKLKERAFKKNNKENQEKCVYNKEELKTVSETG